MNNQTTSAETAANMCSRHGKAATTSHLSPAIITSCGRCGWSRAAFRALTGSCPRCDGYLSTRRIARPHPDTVAAAARNS